jgi:hypothetical protein
MNFFHWQCFHIFQAPDGIFESEFIRSVLKPLMNSSSGSVATEYGNPKAALALTIAGVNFLLRSLLILN